MLLFSGVLLHFIRCPQIGVTAVAPKTPLYGSASTRERGGQQQRPNQMGLARKGPNIQPSYNGREHSRCVIRRMANNAPRMTTSKRRPPLPLPLFVCSLADPRLSRTSQVILATEGDNWGFEQVFNIDGSDARLIIAPNLGSLQALAYLTPTFNPGSNEVTSNRSAALSREP